MGKLDMSIGINCTYVKLSSKDREFRPDPEDVRPVLDAARRAGSP